ncbi:Uncharacterized protein BP5553_07817 [Venustampulla echinocandica]|uniref:Uncharacterized protein n=1 Tax=Venustampulla echinocandica TaxID=2656787 RepID=A0A370THL3_9HELO|nr:Uncharacterized protein BP5553_07817 [Venustampulla echinocandica]RDL34689.1 Uncharacterized protein BP5553_07817 [Venustampulla echinocandica]
MEQPLNNTILPQLCTDVDAKAHIVTETSISSPLSITSQHSSASASTSLSQAPSSAATLKPVPPQPFPPAPKFQENYITNEDRQRVIELLDQQRVAKKENKKIKNKERYNSKEVNPVLDTLVSDKISPSPGLVQALLEQGGDVNVARQKSTAIWKKVARKNQEVRRSDVLAKATQNCVPEVVWVLSREADDTAKTEALLFAIRQNDTVKARILLDAGADSADFHSEFLSAVEKKADEMVEIILRAIKGPCASCCSTGLVKAANNGSLRNSLILLEKGANADFDNGAALQKAIADEREDLTDAISFCANKPSPKSFDIAVGLAYSKITDDGDKQHRMIDICLRGGAHGSTTDETLVKACINGQVALIDNLLAHNASVDYRQGAAIQYAVTSKQPGLLTTLLRGKPSMPTFAASIPMITGIDDPAVAYETTDIVLSAGLRGDSVAATLISVLERPPQTATDSDDLKLIQLFLEKGAANINYDEGKSIQVVATRGWTNALKLLLQHNPSTGSLNGAFPLAMKLDDAARRLEIVTMILEAGAKGAVIDAALVASSCTGKTGVELTSVLLKQSSVDYENGRALCNAVQTECLEQMQALMLGKPSDGTLRAAWLVADALQNGEFQYQAFEILLAASIDSSLKDASLITAATRGQRGINVCTLLLQHQASPDYSNGTCMVSAAKGLHLDTLELLANSVTSASVFCTVFDDFSEGDEWLTPKGLAIVHLLLENGASGPEVDAAFCKAARLGDPDALELLATSVNPEAVNVALVAATAAGKDWLSPDNSHLWLMHSLLKWGAAGDCVNFTLFEALDAFARGLASEDLIDTLLQVGAKAEVNFQNGEAVQIAVRYGKPLLLEKLILCGATAETLSIALAEAITAGLDENVLLSLLDVFMESKGAKPDVKTAPQGYQPPIFACLAAYPQSAKLVKQLVEMGCDLEAQIESFTYDDEELEAENVTALVWALCQPENRISSAAIEALIDAKADTNLTLKTSNATPLILAAKYSRSDLVVKLLAKKVKSSAKDKFDRTALFYASRNGDIDSVNALIKAKSAINDGSLQEAAKKLHSKVVATLIKGKHDPDFPSSKEQHEGRTALQEMALMCDCSKAGAETEETVQALVKGKANPLEKSRGRNALFLALDNANPVPITRAILDGVMWKHMNSDENVYIEVDPETGTKYYFSPTMYVARGFSQGPEEYSDQLQKILVDKRGDDRYYAEEGAVQPADAVGMPQAILDAEKKRKDREEKLQQKELDHQLKLLHERQAADQKAQIEQEKFEEKKWRDEELARQKMEQREMEHEQKLAQEVEKANQKQNIMTNTAAVKISLQNQIDAQKQRAALSRAQFEETQKARAAAQKLQAIQQESELKAQFTAKANAAKLAQQARQNQLAAAAGQQKLLTASKMANMHAAEARNKLAIKERQNEQALRLMRGTAREKSTMHEMQMRQLQAQGQNTKLKMLDKYFASQGQVGKKDLKRIAAG